MFKSKTLLWILGLVVIALALLRTGVVGALYVRINQEPFDEAALVAEPFLAEFEVVAKGEHLAPGDLSAVYLLEANGRAESKFGATVVDFGDVRVVLEGWHHTTTKDLDLIFDSDVPATQAGRYGGGGRGGGIDGMLGAYSYFEGGETTGHLEYEGSGITATVPFVARDRSLEIGGVIVPIGKGNRVVFLSSSGRHRKTVILEENDLWPAMDIQIQEVLKEYDSHLANTPEGQGPAIEVRTTL